MRIMPNNNVKNRSRIPEEQLPETGSEIPIDGNDAEGNPHRIEDRPGIRYTNGRVRSVLLHKTFTTYCSDKLLADNLLGRKT